MKYHNFTDQVQKLFAQRNFAYGVVLFLMLANIILLVGVINRDQRIIIVPSLDNPAKRYVLHGEKLPDNLLVDWANNLLSTLYSVNAENVDVKTKFFLQWSYAGVGLTEKLKEQAHKIKQDKMCTVFYPKDFSINRVKQHVVVSGQFVAFLGRDPRAVAKKTTYELGYIILSTGEIAIKSLKELKK